MSNNLRYYQLLQQIEKNPLRKAVAPAFDIADDFRRDMEELGQNRKWSPEGRQDEAQKHLRRAIRDLRDLQKTALDEFRAKTAAMNASKKLATYDKPDSLDRWKLRDRSINMTFGQRSMRMTGPHRDEAFRDAVLEFAPWVSGFDEFNPDDLKLYEDAKQERDRALNGQLQDTIADREAAVKEVVDLVINVARGDIQSDSGLQSRDFEALARPIETRQNAPWLTSDRKQVIEIDRDGKASYHPASVDEARDGKVFNEAEFRASLTA
jgi:hypothetical protein